MAAEVGAQWLAEVLPGVRALHVHFLSTAAPKGLRVERSGVVSCEAPPMRVDLGGAFALAPRSASLRGDPATHTALLSVGLRRPGAAKVVARGGGGAAAAEDEQDEEELEDLDDSKLDEAEDDAVSPEELRPANYAVIACAFCGSSMRAPDAAPDWVRRVLPLPSPYWQELSDLWFCCDNQSRRMAEVEIRSHAGAVLVGESEVWLHASDVAPRAIKREAAESGSRISCGACLWPLGRVEGDDVRFTKSQVCARAADAPDGANVFGGLSAENVMARRLLAAATSKARYRFVLVDESGSSEAARIDLTILNWRTCVLVPGDSAPARVLKVLYRVGKGEGDTETAPSATDVWPLSADELFRFARALDTSNKRLPAPHAAIGNKRVGLLRLRSAWPARE
jgi:hypothetical protein